MFPDGVSGIPTGDLHLLMRGLFLNVALVLVLDAHFAVSAACNAATWRPGPSNSRCW